MVRYSVGKNTFDNKPRNEEAETFAAFTERVLGLRSTRKGETYIAAPFNGDGTRKKEGALPRCWIPFDFDHIANPETFRLHHRQSHTRCPQGAGDSLHRS